MSEAGPSGDYPHFLGSEIDNAASRHAAFHVLPVPLERTVSYGGGTARGPSAILQASWQLETWDGHSSPCERGIHTRDPVDCSGPGERVMARIAEATAAIVGGGAMPVVIGGEHTVTCGVIQGLMGASTAPLGVVQIDAHADLRDAYGGDKLSHASVMRRVVDFGIPLYQLGVRALCHEEIECRGAHGVRYRDAEELVPAGIAEITLPEDFPDRVFFTVDIDGLDPSVFPSTGTPVPGGLGWYQTLSLFESVARQRRIVGFDIMEFAPIDGFHAYEFSAALLTYKLMGICERHEHLQRSL